MQMNKYWGAVVNAIYRHFGDLLELLIERFTWSIRTQKTFGRTTWELSVDVQINVIRVKFFKLWIFDWKTHLHNFFKNFK